MLIVRRAKLYNTVSGIIKPIGGLPVHGTATYKCDDTRDCIIQFALLKMNLNLVRQVG